MADLDELRATAHPLRLRLLSLLTGAALSAAEAARELGEQQANVSYHLRLLQRAGLIEVTETVRVRGGVAKRYRHTSSSRPYELESRSATNPTPEERETRAAFVAAMGVELRRRLARRRSGAQIFTDAEVWVERETWRRVVELVGQASALLHESATAPRTAGTAPVAMSAALFELDPE
ncbi:helix-turn-helix domain-containing protein [Galbitalea sp. SE-J8]|uniref:helix-turn-helix domain-containing protein n=1 Tax=Galbitalea sp. SE-J8 TaxID=3054952 RepID=UPI00259D1DB2|nr:helix-turn-helix domain-containing protein [Galbitalea sp. SE-J8]MDM4762389.1 helix-turn-helix domain-containing protein [Galbitalea sp. SE-J8]